MSQNHSFWSTLPGMLTGIAAVITAVGGLLLALSQTGLLNDSEKGGTKQDESLVEIHTNDLNTPSSKPVGKSQTTPTTQRSQPVLQWTAKCVESGKIKWWDLDNQDCTSSDKASSDSDFWFKHTNLGPDADFCVNTRNGAKYAPLHADQLPWDVPAGSFVTKGCVVPQGRMIPCVTGLGQPCQFLVRLTQADKHLWTFTFARYQDE